MISRNSCREITPESSKSSGIRFFEGLSHAAWIVPSSAILVVILFLVLGHVRLSETGSRLINSLVYSFFIGVPSSVLLNWFCHCYQKRLGRWTVIPVILLLALTGTLGSLAGAFVLQIAGLLHHDSWLTEFRSSYPFALVLTLLVGFGVTTYATLRDRLQSATLELRTREVEQERAYKLLAEARLSSLESRIHPHFLFNTLNSIASLIPKDPRHAEDTLAKLASLLRFSLHANQSGLVPLSQELKVVRDYLDIESTRFGGRLRYTIDAPESLGSLKAPPLALQLLVENAVKHVVAQRPEGATLQIAATHLDSQLRLEVIDDGPGFSLDAITPEHGLGNLIARMELLFDERGKLDVARRDHRTVVSLTFPAEI